jgi:hypothetical protein
MGQKMTWSDNFLAPKKKAAKKAVFEQLWRQQGILVAATGRVAQKSIG